jgi:hypothetical protein
MTPKLIINGKSFAIIRPIRTMAGSELAWVMATEYALRKFGWEHHKENASASF